MHLQSSFHFSHPDDNFHRHRLYSCWTSLPTVQTAFSCCYFSAMSTPGLTAIEIGDSCILVYQITYLPIYPSIHPSIRLLRRNILYGYSGVGIAQSVLRRAMRRTAGQHFSLFHSVQTGSEAHPASYPMGSGGDFPWGEAAGAWRWSLTFT
jgi:hypothetical protein